MKRNHYRLSAAALALLVCLSVTPVTAAAEPSLGGSGFRQDIIRIFKKIQKKLSGITTLTDFPLPPKP